MAQAQVAHVDELIKTAGIEGGSRDRVIQQSWRRCLEDYKLDPVLPRKAYIHTTARLREHLDAMDGLIRVARFGVESLYRQVSGLGYVLILSDAKGVAVDFIGDSAQDEALRRAGLYRGSDWNERLAGTCAVGTCITTGEALTVHQDDHFSGDHIALTCTAAPIFSTDGTLAAVLDISALRSPTPKASQYLALQLVGSVAHRIETANLHNAFRRDWIVQLSASPEFADIDPDIVLSVDAGGRILGFNSRAKRLLEQHILVGGGRPRTPSGPHPAIGLRFDAVFEASVDDLPGLTRIKPVEQRALRLRGGGVTLFALALRPPEPVRLRPMAPRADIAAPLAHLSGGDAAMDDVARRAGRLVHAGLNILLQGETGTGKEFWARALHKAGPRAGRPFVPVNCAALPENLIESELFGYEPGAFTGAAPKGRHGLVQQAEGGTLFLDEIGDMPLLAQTRLLRVLSEREVTAVGGVRPKPVDIRVIAATHRDLSALVREGRFREDLYFRLNAAVLTLPPLRQRQDFDWLLARLLDARTRAPGPEWRFSPEALAALRAHAWPGNLRELVNTLDYACAMATGVLIALDDLPEIFTHETGAKMTRRATDASEPDPSLLQALRKRSWNVSAVARDAGVDRSTIHRRMRRAGIVSPLKL